MSWYKSKPKVEPKETDWDARLQESINDVGRATGCRVSWSRKGLRGSVKLNDVEVVSYQSANPEFAGTLFLDGIEIGAKLMQGRLKIEPGTKAEPRSRYGKSPEDVYDESFRKAYAKVAVHKLENLSTEGLLLLMRQCFIEGMNVK